VRLLGLVAAGTCLAFAGAWLTTDVLERDNDFCNACHIDGDVPLHIALRRDLDARPPRSLASAHAASIGGARPDDPVMRCFDCHAGVGLVGRVRTKWIAATDLVVWLAGRAEEPESLRWPLVDADCRGCHEAFDADGTDRVRPPFHALPVHNHDLGISCPSCHEVHADDVDPDFHFLATRRVRARCARCHGQFDIPEEETR
jgi:hypothetical protein